MKKVKKEKPKKKQWKNYRWQLAKRIRSSSELLKIFPELSQQEIEEAAGRYKFAITPYFLSLIDKEKGPGDPLALQVLPSYKELDSSGENGEKGPELWTDPFNEQEKQPVPGLIKRYPDRAVVLTTSKCPSLCRYCTRKWNWQSRFTLNREKLEKIVAYLNKNSTIREVILSGGEPFLLKTKKLDRIIGSILDSDHVKVIRIGTRILSFLPFRITGKLTRMLSKHRPVWIVTHFNHPREITADTVTAINRLLDAGAVLCNHTVLLKNVNDNARVLKELFHKLQENRIKPYYLFQCDKVEGTGHFAAPVERGLEIMKKLHGFTGGLSIPQFIIDTPLGGKIPLLPDYIVKREEGLLTLKTYDNKEITYEL